MKALPGVFAVAGVFAFAGAAHAESIVYVADGDLYLTNVERTVRLTTDGGYESPSQDSAGRIVAVRRVEEGSYTNRFVYRFDSSGRRLSDPVRAGEHNYSYFVGPLGAEVSPNGDILAYHYFNRSPGITDNHRPRLSFGYTGRDTDKEEIAEAGYYLNPTWIDSDRVAIFSDPSFSGDVQIYSLTGDAFSDWFDVAGAAVTSGDLSNDVSRLAAIADGGTHLLFYSLEAPPPAAPTFRCAAEGPEGTYLSPTWSPDGTAIAWEQTDGIHLATVGDLAACDIREVGLIPGGSAPFWGNATLPDSTPPPATVVCKVRIPPRVTRRRAMRAIKVKVACPGADRAAGQARVGTETVAKGSQALSAEGAGTLKIKPTRSGRPILREANRARVKVKAGGKRFSKTVKITD